jgi:ornithine--oxo-acid transaminase
MRMFREKNILTQICGNNFMVLKAAPPLVVNQGQLDEFVKALRDVVELADTSARFWTERPGWQSARQISDVASQKAKEGIE